MLEVQKALDEAGIPYEVVKGPLRPGKRDDLERLSGQRKYPVIEFEDGSAYREQSADMAAAIRAGRLDEHRRRAADDGRAAGRARSPESGGRRASDRCGCFAAWLTGI